MHKPKTVAFIYGWSEGNWQSKKFRKLVAHRGYTTVKDPYKADIVIAHSSGCYLVPNNIHPKQIVLIGIPYWPKKRAYSSVAHNITVGLKNHSRGTNFFWWVNKLAHNFFYIFAHPAATYFALTKMKPKNLPEHPKVILIRNMNDTFCHPNIQKLLPKTRSYKFAELPGDHEDCWLHPEPYIKLILPNN
jgi:hypothetical protein